MPAPTLGACAGSRVFWAKPPMVTKESARRRAELSKGPPALAAVQPVLETPWKKSTLAESARFML